VPGLPVKIDSIHLQRNPAYVGFFVLSNIFFIFVMSDANQA
jgi:hypothetical protein